MSKAFTKEDEGGEAPPFVSRRAPLPVGTPNYVTRGGLAALRAELQQLNAARNELVHAGREGLDLARLLTIENARIAELEGRVASAVLVDSMQQAQDQVRFGARVRVLHSSGVERSYRIVGVDEADAKHDALAFVAPLARALLGKRVGDSALVITPSGEDELEILGISYAQGTH